MSTRIKETNFDFSVFRRKTPQRREQKKRKPKTRCTKLYAFYPWVGGKFFVKNWLKTKMPSDYNVYVEPFLGAGSLFLALQPKRCILSDINPYLPLMFWSLKHHFSLFLQCLDSVKLRSPTGSKTEFEAITSAFNAMITPIPADFSIPPKNVEHFVKMAAYFLFLVRRSHNGNLSVDANGKVSCDWWHSRKHIVLYNPALLTAIHDYLITADITFMHGDYRAATALAKKGDLIYLDPPYISSVMKSDYWPYCGTVFNHQDFIRQVHRLSRKGIRVAMTNNYDVDLLKHFSTSPYRVTQMQNVRGFSQGKNGIKHRNDVLITNYA